MGTRGVRHSQYPKIHHQSAFPDDIGFKRVYYSYIKLYHQSAKSYNTLYYITSFHGYIKISKGYITSLSWKQIHICLLRAWIGIEIKVGG